MPPPVMIPPALQLQAAREVAAYSRAVDAVRAAETTLELARRALAERERAMSAVGAAVMLASSVASTSRPALAAPPPIAPGVPQAPAPAAPSVLPAAPTVSHDEALAALSAISDADVQAQVSAAIQAGAVR
jgi:hypothetical protein